MKKALKLIVLFGVCLSLSCGCSRHDKPMPLTKDNVRNYIEAMGAAIRTTNPKDVEEAKGSTQKQKEMFYRSFVEPLEKMGYSYDKTVGDLASKLLTKTLHTSDAEMTVMTSDVLAFAKNTREISFKLGFISKETKDLLDQVSLIFRR